MLTLETSRRTPRRASGLRAWPSHRWCNYFRRQRADRLALPWQRGVELTREEHDLVTGSLREFQQGEGLEGGHFFRCVRAHAVASGDLEYAVAHRLFMEEEQGHARDLGRFLDLAGIPRLTERSLLNRLFCWCGSRGGIELTLAIIAQVEVIAQVYYAALRRATGSVCLRRICAQILRDEKQHVRFQCERLAILRRNRSAPRQFLTRALDVFLFAGAALICWCGHRRVLHAGGLNLVRYARAAWHAFRIAARLNDPHGYNGETD